MTAIKGGPTGGKGGTGLLAGVTKKGATEGCIKDPGKKGHSLLNRPPALSSGQHKRRKGYNYTYIEAGKR